MGKIYKNGIEYGGGGGDSAGHIILDNDGTAMAEEPNLQFKGLNVTDNSTDEVTEVESTGLNQDSMDDILNASVSGNQVASNGLVYSTSEQVVGKWIDGKPVYQKTFRIGALTNSSTWAEKMVNVDADIESIVKIESLLYRNTWIGVAPYSAGDAACMPQVTMSSTPIQVGFAYIKDFSNVIDSYITLQYTKTTDA